MNVLFPILFSLLWGAVIWLISITVFRDKVDRTSIPALFLALIAALVGPSILAAVGIMIPVSPSAIPLITPEIAERNMRHFTQSIETFSGPTGSWDGVLVLRVVTLIYITGVALHLIWLVRTYRYLQTCSRAAAPVGSHSSNWPVRMISRSISPIAFGFGRSCVIILPERLVRTWAADRIAMIIHHEEIHLRHRDPLISSVLGFVVAVFWFNPFLRDLVARWRQSCELRADAGVVKDKSRRDRLEYAETLLAARRARANLRDTSLSLSFTTRKFRSEKMRIRAILQSESGGTSRAKLGFGAVVAIVMLTFLGGTGAWTAAMAAGSEGGMDSFIKGGRMVSPFGVERKNLRVHTGVDVRARKGTPIAAPADALVVEATDLFRNEPRYGKAVVLKFGDDLIGWFTHVDEYTVKAGDRIKKGDVFATVGNTGQSRRTHVHIETYQGADRKRVDPATVWWFLE